MSMKKEWKNDNTVPPFSFFLSFYKSISVKTNTGSILFRIKHNAINNVKAGTNGKKLRVKIAITTFAIIENTISPNTKIDALLESLIVIH